MKAQLKKNGEKAGEEREARSGWEMSQV